MFLIVDGLDLFKVFKVKTFFLKIDLKRNASKVKRRTFFEHQTQIGGMKQDPEW